MRASRLLRVPDANRCQARTGARRDGPTFAKLSRGTGSKGATEIVRMTKSRLNSLFHRTAIRCEA